MGRRHRFRQLGRHSVIGIAVGLLLACGTDDPSPPLLDASRAEPTEDSAIPSGFDGGATRDASSTEADAQSSAPPSDATVADSKDAAGDLDASHDTGSADLSPGCAGGTTLDDGMSTIDAAGLSRKYVLRKPASYSSQRAWPLVLALHPNGSNTSYWDGTTGDRALRPLLADKAVLLVAQARVDDWRGDLPSDLSYFDAVIARLENALCIDRSRIFAMGFSGGGSFSGVLGCSRRDIRALAVGGAVEYFDPKTCVGTPAAWITIGDDEAIADRITFRDFWRTYDGCSANSAPTSPAPCLAYSCPNPQRPVQFCSHPGGHEWPSFGTDAAWSFFARF